MLQKIWHELVKKRKSVWYYQSHFFINKKRKQRIEAVTNPCLDFYCFIHFIIFCLTHHVRVQSEQLNQNNYVQEGKSVNWYLKMFQRRKRFEMDFRNFRLFCSLLFTKLNICNRLIVVKWLSNEKSQVTSPNKSDCIACGFHIAHNSNK